MALFYWQNGSIAMTDGAPYSPVKAAPFGSTPFETRPSGALRVRRPN